MKWIKITDQLPPENEYVLGVYGGGNHISKADPLGILVNVVRLVKDISQKQRDSLPEGSQRRRLYYGADEQGNNKVPYSWESFGPIKFFGQDIVCWAKIDRSFKKHLKLRE